MFNRQRRLLFIECRTRFTGNNEVYRYHLYAIVKSNRIFIFQYTHFGAFFRSFRIIANLYDLIWMAYSGALWLLQMGISPL